jgi:hypothetical protein
MLSMTTNPSSGLPELEAVGEKRLLACLEPHGQHNYKAYFAQRQVMEPKDWIPGKRLAFVRKIYNQKNQGSCVGQGSVGGLRTKRIIQGFQDVDLSPWDVYARINGGRDNGAVVSDSLQELEKGVCTETACPPMAIYPRLYDQNKAKAERPRFRITRAETVNNYKEVGTALQYNEIVVFGTMVGGNFDPASNGVIGPRRGNGGGHCMYAIDVINIGGEMYIVVINSWGEKWGLNGICYLHQSYFEGRYFDAYCIYGAEADPDDAGMPTPPIGPQAFDERLVA